MKLIRYSYHCLLSLWRQEGRVSSNSLRKRYVYTTSVYLVVLPMFLVTVVLRIVFIVLYYVVYYICFCSSEFSCSVTIALGVRSHPQQHS
jgi:hypothetical protein